MTKDDITALLTELCAKLAITLDGIEVTEVANHTLFMLNTKDSGAIIGARGETLSALNYVVKKMVENKSGTEAEPLKFVVDVNGYHLKHIRMLEGQANMLAERARTFKYDIEMSPMKPYDRMIVHAALQGSPSVYTESVGDGMMRHIVIRYSETGAPKAAATENAAA